MRHAYKADIDFCSKIDNIVLNGESRETLINFMRQLRRIWGTAGGLYRGESLVLRFEEGSREPSGPRIQGSRGMIPAWQMSSPGTALFHALLMTDITNRSCYVFLLRAGNGLRSLSKHISLGSQ